MRDKLNKYNIQLAVLKAALKGNTKAKIVIAVLAYIFICGIIKNVQLINSLFN